MPGNPTTHKIGLFAFCIVIFFCYFANLREYLLPYDMCQLRKIDKINEEFLHHRNTCTQNHDRTESKLIEEIIKRKRKYSIICNS